MRQLSSFGLRFLAFMVFFTDMLNLSTSAGELSHILHKNSHMPTVNEEFSVMQTTGGKWELLFPLKFCMRRKISESHIIKL